jgi:hypothetical protein
MRREVWEIEFCGGCIFEINGRCILCPKVREIPSRMWARERHPPRWCPLRKKEVLVTLSRPAPRGKL